MRLASLLLAAACFTVGSLACAPARTSLGDADLRRYTDITGSPTTFGVETGRMVSGDFDVVIDASGCARGLIAERALVLCPKELPAASDVPGERATRWNGDGADFVTRVAPDGATLRVDGTVGSRGLHTTLRFGTGPQWDELRREPVLYSLAASVVGINGEPPPPRAD